MTGAKFCDFEKMAAIFLKYWDKYLIDGVSYTLLLSAITVLGGVVFASLLALMKMSKVAPLRWLSTIYIEVIRGTPMLLQLYFFYFGLPMLIPALNKQKFLCIASIVWLPRRRRRRGQSLYGAGKAVVRLRCCSDLAPR